MRGIIFLLAVFSACSAWADGFTVKCGGYTMVANQGELSTINGERVTSQKITELGTNGLKVDMGLMPAKDGNNYGFEYIRRPGTAIPECPASAEQHGCAENHRIFPL